MRYPVKLEERTVALIRATMRLADRGPAFRVPLRLLDSVSRLGKDGAAPVPPQLLPMGARVLGQGYLNRVALPLLGGWLLPRWMREQSDPTSPFFVPRSVHNVMVNQTQRNWTALGLPGADHKIESIVDSWGLLTPTPGGPSLDWWAEVDGSGLGVMCASRWGRVTQRLQGRLPVVSTAFEAGGVRVSSESWVLPLPGHDWAAMQVVLFNIADVPVTGTFRFALRPYNPEGISPIYRIEYTRDTLRAGGRPGPITWPRPDSWRLSNLEGGDLFHGGGTHERRLDDPRGFAHGVLEYRFAIEPWEEAEFLAFMPIHRTRGRASSGGEGRGLFPAADLSASPRPLPHPLAYSRAKAATTLRWREILEAGVRLDLPDRDLQESWEANVCHLLALHDGYTITPGPDLYHAYWIRDAALMAYALSAAGYGEAARLLVLGTLRFRKADGSFVSQSSEWDGTGQALWCAARHLLMHPDNTLLARLRLPIEGGAQWIARTLARNGGLMPSGLSSEHFGPPDHYYWDNLWSLAGLEAAHTLTGQDWIASEARALRERLRASFADNVVEGALPGAPGRPSDLSAVGTVAAWYPLDLFPPADPYLAATLAALDRLFYDGALFMNTGHSGWGTYVNMRLSGCYNLLGSSRGWDLTRWLLRHASPSYNWPEAIHPKSGRGSAGDGHHGWASAEWLLLVRSMLMREENDTLLLAPAIPSDWLSVEGCVRVENAPTMFGMAGYLMEWSSGAETARVDIISGPRAGTRLLWRAPAGQGAIVIDGSAADWQGGPVLLPPGARRVEFRRQEE